MYTAPSWSFSPTCGIEAIAHAAHLLWRCKLARVKFIVYPIRSNSKQCVPVRKRGHLFFPAGFAKGCPYDTHYTDSKPYSKGKPHMTRDGS